MTPTDEEPWTDEPPYKRESEKERKRGLMRLDIVGVRNYRVGAEVCMTEPRERVVKRRRAVLRKPVYWVVVAVSPGEILLRRAGLLRRIRRSLVPVVKAAWRRVVHALGWPARKWAARHARKQASLREALANIERVADRIAARIAAKQSPPPITPPALGHGAQGDPATASVGAHETAGAGDSSTETA